VNELSLALGRDFWMAAPR